MDLSKSIFFLDVPKISRPIRSYTNEQLLILRMKRCLIYLKNSFGHLRQLWAGRNGLSLGNKNKRLLISLVWRGYWHLVLNSLLRLRNWDFLSSLLIVTDRSLSTRGDQSPKLTLRPDTTILKIWIEWILEVNKFLRSKKPQGW